MYSDAKTYLSAYLVTQGYTAAPVTKRDSSELSALEYHNYFIIKPGATKEGLRPNTVKQEIIIIVHKAESEMAVTASTDIEAATADECSVLVNKLAKAVNADTAGRNAAIWDDVSGETGESRQGDYDYRTITITIPIIFTPTES